MGNPGGFEIGTDVELIIGGLVGDEPLHAASAGRQIIACRNAGGDASARHGAGRAGTVDIHRLQIGGQAECPVGLAGNGILLDIFITREVADLQLIAECMAENGLQAIGLAVLPVEIGKAIIAAAVEFFEKSAIIGIIAKAILRHRLVIQMLGLNGQAGRTVDADGDGGRDAPALIIFDIAAGHVIFMIDCVDPHRDQVVQSLVRVHGRSVIIVRADTCAEHRLIIRQRPLGHQIDRAGNRTTAVHDRIGTVGHFDLLDIVDFVAVEEGTRSHTVDGHVILCILAAQDDPIAIAKPAFTRAERDARYGRKNIAQRQEILLLDRCFADDRDGLRRVEQGTHIFGRFRLFDFDC